MKPHRPGVAAVAGRASTGGGTVQPNRSDLRYGAKGQERFRDNKSEDPGANQRR